MPTAVWLYSFAQWKARKSMPNFTRRQWTMIIAAGIFVIAVAVAGTDAAMELVERLLAMPTETEVTPAQ